LNKISLAGRLLGLVHNAGDLDGALGFSNLQTDAQWKLGAGRLVARVDLSA
jgi:hypothetical protein